MSDSEHYHEFVRLIRLNTSQILAYINAILVNWNDAEDLLQETCLVLWQKFDQFQPGTNFLAWALRIAEHKVMDFHKMQARRTAFTSRLRDVLKEDFVAQSEETVAANLAALSRCMDALTDSDREMVTLCYGDGWPVPKVADAMGCSTRTAYRSLHRVRNVLLECIRRNLGRDEASTTTYTDNVRPNG